MALYLTILALFTTISAASAATSYKNYTVGGTAGWFFNYFFSDYNEGLQCQQGLAFQIQVQRGIGLPPSLNQPPPPPYIEPPGPDSAESPSVTVPQTPNSGAFANRGADVCLAVYGLGVALVLLQLQLQFW
jgi:hypothetical protein